MKIFGSPLSPFVARVILACDHKGIEHSVEMPEGGLKSPEFLSLNPFRCEFLLRHWPVKSNTGLLKHPDRASRFVVALKFVHRNAPIFVRVDVRECHLRCEARVLFTLLFLQQ